MYELRVGVGSEMAINWCQCCQQQCPVLCGIYQAKACYNLYLSFPHAPLHGLAVDGSSVRGALKKHPKNSLFTTDPPRSHLRLSSVNKKTQLATPVAFAHARPSQPPNPPPAQGTDAQNPPDTASVMIAPSASPRHPFATVPPLTLSPMHAQSPLHP